MGMHCVNFFGTNDFAWIEEFNIKDYVEFKDTLAKTKANKQMKQAQEEMDNYLKSRDSSAAADTKMNLVLQTMMGVTLAGLAEGMALADRAGLQQKDVLEVLELTGLACPTILGKGKAIIDGGFPTHQPLQHMQKDLKLSLNMGDQLEQPLPLTASANEVFKHAKRLGYGEHDVSAVYIRARF